MGGGAWALTLNDVTVAGPRPSDERRSEGERPMVGVRDPALSDVFDELRRAHPSPMLANVNTVSSVFMVDWKYAASCSVTEGVPVIHGWSRQTARSGLRARTKRRTRTSRAGHTRVFGQRCYAISNTSANPSLQQSVLHGCVAC